MKEKLIIKNFGPIKSVELKLGKLTVLIGEQATGKSTVAKVLAVCRYFSYLINYQGVFSTPIESKFSNGLSAWGLDDFLKPESFIYYKGNHYTLNVSYRKKVIRELDANGKANEHSENLFLPQLTEFSTEFSNVLKELQNIKPKSETEEYDLGELFGEIPASFFQNVVSKILDNPFYLPSERGLQSIFSLGKSSIQNLSDALFNQLANIDRIARMFKSETSIEPLDIKYKNINGHGYVKKNGETEFYSLFNAATGYQSAIPIVLTCKYYNELRKKSKTLIIEEPEQNLFPSSQQKLIQFLVENITNHGNSIILTTHSPYVLTSINNLLYAYKVGEHYKEDAGKIVEEKYWLKQEDFSVYKLNPDGTCEDIFDYEEGLIKAEKIDGISSLLNKQFDALLDLQYAEK